MTIVVNPLQSEKANDPIEVTDTGYTKDLKVLFPVKLYVL